MKILLHMGPGKTGTTALQQSLHDGADVLRARSVLYPRFGGSAIAHHLLLALCEHPDRLTGWTLQEHGGPEATADRAWQVWNELCLAVAARPPRVLVLSSEVLFQQARGKAKALLAETLSELTTDIMPILYIRDPVSQYRARLQEWLKTENAPLPPSRLPLRETILDTAAAFGRPPELVAFDRATLKGGDITTDFVTRFLGPEVTPDDVPRHQANVGLSAEALVLLARLRRDGGLTAAARRRGERLIRPLAALDRSDPPDAPLTLHPEVAEAALRAATCHRWLAETGRLVLPGLDTGRIDGAPPPGWMQAAPPETLFPHDPARLARLTAALWQSHPHLMAG